MLKKKDPAKKLKCDGIEEISSRSDLVESVRNSERVKKRRFQSYLSWKPLSGLFSHLPQKWRNTVIVATASCGLLFGILYVSSSQKEELNLHLAKTIAQFVVVVLLGAFVADYFKQQEQNRRDMEAFAVFREEVRKRLTDCYQKTKASRSALRAAGINEYMCNGKVQFNEQCIEAYRCQMEKINEIQLDLEKLWHEIDTFSTLFTSTDSIVRRIKIMSGFLRKTIDEYEESWCRLQQCTDSPDELNLTVLKHLVGSSTQGWFKERFCDRYSEAVELIRCESLRVKT